MLSYRNIIIVLLVVQFSAAPAMAQEKQARLQQVADRVEKELGIAGIRYGCDLNGYYGGQPRMPLLPLRGEERAEIEALMQGLRN